MRRSSIRPFRSRALWLLLILYITISLGYQIVATVSLVVGYFDLRRQVENPFDIDYSRPAITTVTEPARRAGLTVGDTVESLNGVPYTGRAQWQSTRWYARADDVMRVGVRLAGGARATVSVPLTGFPAKRTGLEDVFVIFLHIVVPLFCLAIGYWVAIARPNDPNAWLILFLLSFP